jgi:hypothetical protein
LQAGFFSSLDRRPPNLGVKEVKLRVISGKNFRSRYWIWSPFTMCGELGLSIMIEFQGFFTESVSTSHNP